jgi:pimeloyl-ACP methyl ester carboxylesterase
MLPAPVVGHSLGGMVVLRLALRRPDAVRASCSRARPG